MGVDNMSRRVHGVMGKRDHLKEEGEKLVVAEVDQGEGSVVSALAKPEHAESPTALVSPLPGVHARKRYSNASTASIDTSESLGSASRRGPNDWEDVEKLAGDGGSPSRGVRGREKFNSEGTQAVRSVGGQKRRPRNLKLLDLDSEEHPPLDEPLPDS